MDKQYIPSAGMTPEQLTQHLINHHDGQKDGTNEYKFTCPECGGKASYNPTLSYDGVTGGGHCFQCDYKYRTDSLAKRLTGQGYTHDPSYTPQAKPVLPQSDIQAIHDSLTAIKSGTPAFEQLNKRDLHRLAELGLLLMGGEFTYSVVNKIMGNSGKPKRQSEYDGALFIPVRDHQGALVSIKYRLKKPTGKTKYLYPVSGLKALSWHSPDFMKYKIAIICEGEFNAMAAYSTGLKGYGFMGMAGKNSPIPTTTPLNGCTVYLYADNTENYNAVIEKWANQAYILGAFQVFVLPPLSDKKDFCDLNASGELGAWLTTTLPTAKPMAAPSVALTPEQPKTMTASKDSIVVPTGFAVNEDNELQKYKGENPKTICLTWFKPVGKGENVDTGETYYSIQFSTGEKIITINEPAKYFATKKGLFEVLAGKAPINENNAKDLTEYFTNIFHLNAEIIPTKRFSARFGAMPDKGFLTHYEGINTDIEPLDGFKPLPENSGVWAGTFKAVLEEWKNIDSLLLSVGFSLASPLIGLLGVRRNPALNIYGDSNSGKTTGHFFAMAAWCNPFNQENYIQVNKATTIKGILQSLEVANGLPYYLDDYQTLGEDYSKLETAIYSSANGQSYTKGGKDGKAIQGGKISGCLLLSGEYIPTLVNSGANNRVLSIPVDQYPTLGVGKGEQGKERAELLEKAALEGYGHFGGVVYRAIMQDFGAFKEHVEELRERNNLGNWTHALSVIMATLYKACELLDVHDCDKIDALPDMLKSLINTQVSENDPSVAAWEQLQSYLAMSEEGKAVHSEDKLFLYDRKPLGFERDGVTYVVAGHDVLASRLGKDFLFKHGQKWVKMGLVEPDSRGKASKQKRFSNVVTRVIEIKK